jgi:propanol-preferring alcohol dehydrogenase
LILGHEIVGIVEAAGADVVGVHAGDRVGVAWLGWTCGSCAQCFAGRENLCDAAEFTGYTRDGGYAEALAVEASYAFPIPDGYRDEEAAPLLCAGLIGYRAYRFAGLGQRLGLYGFGAAAHLLAQLAVHEGREVYAFTKAGDAAGQEFARSLGVAWAGSSADLPPKPLNAAILFAPVGALIPAALRAVGPGGTVVCAGIHMSDIPSFPYEILWEERVLRSVANLTREDGEAFLQVAPSVPIRASVEVLPLEQANRALDRLRAGTVEGALVLVP